VLFLATIATGAAMFRGPSRLCSARLPPRDSFRRSRWVTEEAISADLLDLVKRCRDGDPDAWRALLAPFQEVGQRALRSFRLPAADCDDILSEVLAGLYAGGLSRFRGATVGEFIGFLKIIVRNRAIDFVKERNRWTSSESPAEEYTEESVAAAIGRSPLNVSMGLAHDECVDFLREEVGKLGRSDRELFLMKARGLKEREIVEQTGRPPGTVSSQIARLLDRLRERLRARGCL
jgi:RNA polymerase sigma factor (sigma-70 family)